MRDGSMATGAQFQAGVKDLVAQAVWDGLTRAEICAILSALAVTEKNAS